MLTEDLLLQRPVPLSQALSILSFCQFVAAARLGDAGKVPDHKIPLAHQDFYRRTIDRLIAEGELPARAGLSFVEHFPAASHAIPLAA